MCRRCVLLVQSVFNKRRKKIIIHHEGRRRRNKSNNNNNNNNKISSNPIETKKIINIMLCSVMYLPVKIIFYKNKLFFKKNDENILFFNAV